MSVFDVLTSGKGTVLCPVPNICLFQTPAGAMVPMPTPGPVTGQGSDLDKGKCPSKVLVENKKPGVKKSPIKKTMPPNPAGTPPHKKGLVSSNDRGPAAVISVIVTTVTFQGDNPLHVGSPFMGNKGCAGNTTGAAASGTKKVKVGPGGLPVLKFDAKKFEKKVKNIKKKMGKKKRMKLTRQTGRSKIRKNRRAALKGKKKGPTGTSLDEFPFASTVQGGAGAEVAPIPVSEQNSQGGTMAAFYRANGLGDGDSFWVSV